MSRGASIVVWVVLACLAAGVQVAARRSRAFVGFGTALQQARRSALGRWALLVGWAWLGWHLFVR